MNFNWAVVQDNLRYLLWGRVAEGESGGLLLTMLIALAVGVIALAFGVLQVSLAGLRALPTGQVEADLASGLSHWHVLRLILLPQAWPNLLPSWTGLLTLLIKDTSLAFIGNVSELTTVARAESLDSGVAAQDFGAGAVARYGLALVKAVRIEGQVARCALRAVLWHYSFASSHRRSNAVNCWRHIKRRQPALFILYMGCHGAVDERPPGIGQADFAAASSVLMGMAVN